VKRKKSILPALHLAFLPQFSCVEFSTCNVENQVEGAQRVRNEGWDLICSSACNDFMCFWVCKNFSSPSFFLLRFSSPSKLIKVLPCRCVARRNFESPLNTFPQELQRANEDEEEQNVFLVDAILTS
jgi:hypothetical protein